MKQISDTDRRSGQDRRKKHFSFFKFIFSKGNRQALRRVEDSKRVTPFDYYHPNLFITIVIVLCLSLLDAALTLILLDKGAVELNPVMRYYLSHGSVVFVLVKYGLTALALLIIVVLHGIITTRYRRGSLLLPFCGLAFGLVVIWEIYLLAR